MSVNILHITDIHAGPAELRDEDIKEHIPITECARMLDRLTSYLRALPCLPNYVVITGDLTICGDRKGLGDFRSWILQRVSEKTLPDFNHIIIVPGNHDVVWADPTKEYSCLGRERYSAFFDTIAKVFPHAYLPDCDPPLKSNELNFDPNATMLQGGLRTATKLDSVEVVENHPFILDIEKDILIFAFNSTIGCGIPLEPYADILENLDNMGHLCGSGNQAIEEKIEQIRNAYLQSLVIDAGYIGDYQLNYFKEIMTDLKKMLGPKYTRLTKIAVLHHHVGHIWQQQLEVKKFESVLDAAKLKQYLVEFEFDLVLHGHKHINNVALEGTIFPNSSPERFNPLCIVSGGTIGGTPRLNDRQSFKLISFNEDTGPRTTAELREIPLLDRADPGLVFKNKSKVYSVPIFSRLPVLHDSKAIIDALDSFMRNNYATELIKSEHPVISGAKFTFPAAHPNIVGIASRYNYDSVVELPDEKVFYDIIETTQRLDFRQKARIYWMLTDVNGLKERNGKESKVVLLIGNLEETHFFQGLIRDEVTKSIEEINEWFMPAIESGLLEIRVHTFSQEEIDNLGSKVPSHREGDNYDR